MPADTAKFFAEHRRARPIEFVPSRDAKQVLRESLLPYLPIVGFDMPVRQMYEEAAALMPKMVEHRSAYESNRGWKSIVLHGLGDHMTEGAERYGLNPEDETIYSWTDASKLAPVTTAFFRDQFRYDHFQRVRLMLLEPGGYISPHTDFDKFTLGPVNIALNNPEGCDFVMENVGTLPFRPGTIMKLALVNKHAVFNDSNVPRIHVIVHGKPNWEHWQPLYMRSYRALIESDSSRFVERRIER